MTTMDRPVTAADGVHEAVREAVRSLLARHPPVRSAAVGVPEDYDRVLWNRLCGEIGAAGFAVPERYGGAGGTLLETQVVLEELGRTLTPAPLLASAVLATHALLRCAEPGAQERLLPGIAAGRRIATLVWDGAAAPAQVRPGGLLCGAVPHVLDGDQADVLLVVTRDGLYEVDTAAPGVARRTVPTMDATRRLAAVELHEAPGHRLGPPVPLDELRAVACVALGAEQAGAAARALELTVAYTTTRVQFGRPIGAFQALQHRLADLYVRVDGARSICRAAAAALVSGAPDAPVLASAAKVYCSETLHRAAAEMVQMHGGIAITWEHDAHRYLKRAHGSAQLFGTPAEHLAAIAAGRLDDAG